MRCIDTDARMKELWPGAGSGGMRLAAAVAAPERLRLLAGLKAQLTRAEQAGTDVPGCRRLSAFPRSAALLRLAAAALLLLLAGLLLPPLLAERAILAQAASGGEVWLFPAGGGDSRRMQREMEQTVREWQGGLRQPGGSSPRAYVAGVLNEQGQPVLQVSVFNAAPEEAEELARRLEESTGQPRSQVLAISPLDPDSSWAVRPLDDPENPYRGQYSEIDRWIYVHAWTYQDLLAARAEVSRQQQAHERGAGPPPHVRFMTAKVDEAGWLRPVLSEYPIPGSTAEQPPAGASLRELDRWQRQQARARYERQRDDERTPTVELKMLDTASGEQEIPPGSTPVHDKEGKVVGYFVPPGQPDVPPPAPQVQPVRLVAVYATPTDDAMYQKYMGSTVWRAYRLHEVPKIPGWLAAAPPYLSILVPNGEVATYGKVGDPLPDDEPLPDGSSRGYPQLGWYRYSAEGELLAELQPGNPDWQASPTEWVRLYAPQLRELTTSEPESDRWYYGYDPARQGGTYWVRLSRPVEADSPEVQQWLDPKYVKNGRGPRIDQAAREVVAAYAYDGTPLDPDRPVPPELLVPRRSFKADQLKRYYDEQQHSGIWFELPE